MVDFHVVSNNKAPIISRRYANNAANVLKQNALAQRETHIRRLTHIKDDDDDDDKKIQ